MNSLEYGIGLDIVLFFHSWYLPVTAWFWQALHVIGGEKGFLIILPLLYWAINKHLAIRLFVLIMTGATIMNVLKLFFARPRPFDVAGDLIQTGVSQGGYGLPSGHVWLSLLLSFSLAFYFGKGRLYIIALCWVVLMMVSRMVLGVHYLQDVVLGLILGAINFIVFIKYYQSIFSWFMNKPFITEFLYILVFLLTVQLLGVVLHDAFEFRKSLFAGSGVLVGGCLGALIEKKYIGFKADGLISHKIYRIVLGLILLAGFYVVISQLYYILFVNQQSLFANLFYQIRYALVGIWVTLVMPYVFNKIGLFVK